MMFKKLAMAALALTTVGACAAPGNVSGTYPNAYASNADLLLVVPVLLDNDRFNTDNVLRTANYLGAFDGRRHTERFVHARNRSHCAEYALNHGSRDPMGAAWQCGAFGQNGISVASDIKSVIGSW